MLTGSASDTAVKPAFRWLVRIVVGEFLDRHYVPIVNLLTYGNVTGLELSGRLGPPFAYFARLRPDRCAGGTA